MKRENYNFVFIFLLLLSIAFYLLGRMGTFGFLEKASTPLQRSTFGIFQFFGKIGESEKIKSLEKENLELTKKFLDQKKLEAEISAFRDQFETETIRTNILLPSDIVGMKGFLPNTPPSEFIIDKGKKDGIVLDDAVIFEDNLIGKVEKTSEFLSKVLLITNSDSSFAAKTEAGVLGVVKGQGNGEMIFQNVLLSENLKVGELVFTSPDSDLEGRGIVSNLIVGKISSIEKNPSDLFQKAKLKALVDYSKLSKVFIVRNLR